MKGEIRRLMIRVLSISAGIAVAMAIAVMFLKDARAAISIGAGFVVSAASFGVLAGVVHSSLSGAGGLRAGLLVGLGLIKLGIIGAVLWWLITKGHVGPLAFLAGFSSLVAALLIEGTRASRTRGGVR